jgi:hypothetical protein
MTVPPSASLETAELPQDTRYRIRHDLPCACGYNLRGLSLLDRCPECGGEIASNPWRTSILDRTWSTRVSRGSLLLVFLVAPPTFFVLRYSGTRFLWLALLLDVLGAFGAWLVSARDPASGRPRHDAVLRGLLRFASASWVAAGVFALIRERWPLFRNDTLSLVYHAQLALVLYLTFGQLENVAERLGRSSLVRCCTAARFLVPLVAVVPAVTIVTEDMLGWSTAARVWDPLMIVRSILGLGAVFLLGHLHCAVRAATPPRLR